MKTRRSRFCFYVATALLGGCLLVIIDKFLHLAIVGTYPWSSKGWGKRLILELQKPLGELLLGLHPFTQAGMLLCLGFLLILWIKSHPTFWSTFFHNYVGKSTPETLGAIRILTGGFLLSSTLWEDLPSTAILPKDMRIPMGMLDWFYALPIGFEKFVESQLALQTFKWLTVLLLFLATIGWQTRFTIPAGAFCYFLIGGIIRHYEHFGHSGIVPLYLMAVLSFTPCGDSFSVDRWWKVYQGKVVPVADYPSVIYGWSRYACWVVMALVYLSAGMSKLFNGGLFWWNAINMKGIVLDDTLNPARVDWGLGLHFFLAPDILFVLLGIFGLFSELGYVLVLFSPVARKIFPVAAMMLHTGIFILQNVAFFDLILLQFVFFDFTKIRNAIVHKSAANFVSNPLISDHNSSSTSVANTTIPFKKSSHRFYYPTLAGSLFFFLTLVWILRIEFYPFTSWQMYSQSKVSGNITYYKVLAHHESGIIYPARLDRAIGAMANGRYLKIVRRCFEPTGLKICQKFLTVSATSYNSKVSPDNQVTHFECQKWMWNFLSQPLSSQPGKLLSRYIFKINRIKSTM